MAVPVNFLWKPGQHIFIRFLTLGLHSLTSHPFTICSLPPPRSNQHSHPQDLPKPAELVFYIRPRGGFTKRLALIAAKSPNASLRVLLNGPYGGLPNGAMAKFCKVLLIAGGSGAGFLLPLMEDTVRCLALQWGEEESSKDGPKELIVRDPRRTNKPTEIQVILATRDAKTEKWFRETIKELLAPYPVTLIAKVLTVSIHYTGPSSSASSSPFALASSNDSTDTPPPLPLPEKTLEPLTANLSPDRVADSVHPTTILTTSSPSPSPSTQTININIKPLQHHRPDLLSIISQATASSTPDVDSSSSVGVAVCGPAGMLHDVRNAAAKAQVRIVRGQAGGVREMFLHMEHFSW